MENNEHYRYRLTIDDAKNKLFDEISKIDSGKFKYIYLFAFNNDDKLIWADALRPDIHETELQFMLSLAEDFVGRYEGIYFMMKIKSFNDYFEGYADMAGTMESARGFIKAWKGFEDKEGGNIPALRRYTVEFVNNSLGLPFRYSEDQREIDMKELLPKKKWWKIWL